MAAGLFGYRSNIHYSFIQEFIQIYSKNEEFIIVEITRAKNLPVRHYKGVDVQIS